MRYYYVLSERENLEHFDLRLQWWHFDKRRPWLDRENPTVDLTLMLLGDNVHEIELEWQDRHGTELPHKCLTNPKTPEGRPAFLGQPVDLRRLERHQLRLEHLGHAELRDRLTGAVFLRLEPEISCPRFLFNLLEELRQEHGIGGFKEFVETGTLFGHTTLHASYWFDRVTTIELSSDLHAEAVKHLAHRPNILCLHGNSADVLPDVIEKLAGPTLFFLDAHWSGDSSVDWENSLFSGYPADTARLDHSGLAEAERQVPLMNELESIAAGHLWPAVVVIDDWGSIGGQDFAFSGEDWSAFDRQKILERISGHDRTLFHFPYDEKRYVWGLGPMSEGAG